MKVDERYKMNLVRHFSSGLKNAEPEVIDQLQEMFNNDQPDEFYVGLLSGFVSSNILIEKKFSYLIPLLIGFLANKMEQKEVIT